MEVKFLIVRFSSIGDIVLTTPVIRCLKTQVEGAQVHYLTKKKFESVIEANPYVDKIYTLENNFPSIVSKLRKEHYHYIIDLHKNLRTLRLKSQLRILSFTFNKLNFKKWLIVNLKINKLPDIHIVDRYLKAVTVFDVKNDNKGLDYFIPDNQTVDIVNTNNELSNGYIVYAIGGRHFTKQLPTDKTIDLLTKIEYPVVLLGDSEDYEKGEVIVNSSAGKVFNYCGRFSINQSASVVRQSRLVISHDTGLMHIAAAFKKRIISVWGNTIPEFGMSPYLPAKDSHIIQIKGLSCRPCSKIGFKKCPKKHFKCMLEIDSDKVAGIANNLFKSD
jgi:ADP-heptose:LPS heptosyltransferase